MRSRSRWPGVVLACLIAASGAGCSIMFAEGPPPYHERMRYFYCDDDERWFTLDALAGFVTAAVGAEEASDRQGAAGVATAVGVTAVVAVFAVSAVVGKRAAERCHDARTRLEQRTGATGPPSSPGQEAPP